MSNHGARIETARSELLDATDGRRPVSNHGARIETMATLASAIATVVAP